MSQPEELKSPVLEVLPAGRLWTPKNLRQQGELAVRASLAPSPGDEPDPLQLLHELEPVVASNLNRHLGMAQDWSPRDYYPMDADGHIIGRAADQPDGQPLIGPETRIAMVLNLLTEDNLPSYHHIIRANFGDDDAWGTWVHRWTAEENRHAIALRTYLDLTGAVDPDQLERERLAQVGQGFDDGNKDPLHTLVYVSFQELATRVSHSNTGRFAGDPLVKDMLDRIAKDENLHMLFYRNLVKASFDIAPNQTMRAITDELVGFEMPGANIKGYPTKSLIIASAGIYDLRQHYKDVVSPVLRAWNVWDREDLGGDGELARQELATFMQAMDAQAARQHEQLARMRERGTMQRIIDRSI